MECIINFAIFSVLSIFFRFIIGNPITSSRMQTKYKFKKIPNIVNFILFYNVSKKPISVHVIIFQLQNYIVLLISFMNSLYSEIYFKIECFAGFVIIIVPLFIETLIDMMRGIKWSNFDNSIELCFDECKITFFATNQSIILYFGTYIGNRIVFFNEANVFVGEGKIDYRRKKLFISQIDLQNPYLQSFDNTISFHKNTENGSLC